jgi:hypothetical protein
MEISCIYVKIVVLITRTEPKSLLCPGFENNKRRGSFAVTPLANFDHIGGCA